MAHRTNVLRALVVAGVAALGAAAVSPAYAGPAVEGFTIDTPTIHLGEPFSLTITCVAPHDFMSVAVESAPGQAFTNFAIPFVLSGLTAATAPQLYPTTTGQL